MIEEKLSEEITAQEELNSDIKIVSDNEIEVVNILKETTLVVEIEYVQNEELNIEDLYKEICELNNK